ncbi:molybdenum cofactor guanylyltransferase [Pseudocolwellia agarivorans]|uniref:molybdenum cofactor guanylyltransferase n=1 Tax=Pseudocolwellia agarivorans TaxID=1911682 RepID=UPI003F885BF5
MISLSNKNSLPNNTTQQHSSCLGVVLAGGLSSRMGIDKASLQRNQIDMLSYSKQLLTGSGIKNIVISGEPSCSSSQDILVADKYKEAGPMGGIASVIEKHKPAALLILPVDLPLMTMEALQKLKQVGELSQQACFYNDNYLPLYLPINAHTENFLKTAFIHQTKQNDGNKKMDNKTFSHSNMSKSKSGPSMRALLNQIPHKAISINTPASLFNANTPEDWALAQKRF